MLFNIPTNNGLIKTILIIVIALLILAYFGLNLRSIVNSPTFQDNWALIRDFVVMIWNNYLRRPALYLWNEIFIKLIWSAALENLHRMATGQQSTVLEHIPTIGTSTPSY
jgi:hypothetical protein